MEIREQERALVGAALLDEAVARLLLTELEGGELTDTTARLAWWALRRAYHPSREVVEELERAARQAELQEFEEMSNEDEGVDRTDLEIVVESLDCAGLLVDAGGQAGVAGLVEDRPALRAALTAGRAAIAAIRPVAEEPLVALAASLLGDSPVN